MQIEKQMIKFPSIGRFDGVVSNVLSQATKHGLDLPKIRYGYSCKMHGTNASVVFDFRTGETYAQSRERILSLDSDNAGFCAFAHRSMEGFRLIAEEFRYNICPTIRDDSSLVIYGEWIGPGIHSGHKDAVCRMDEKRFFVIGVKLVFGDASSEDDTDTIWFPPDQVVEMMNLASANSIGGRLSDFNIYNIFDPINGTSGIVDIDFANLGDFQDFIRGEMDIIEKQCPVGRLFNTEGPGEGFVFVPLENPGGWINRSNLTFKVKTEAHSEQKRENVDRVAIDPARFTAAKQFADAHTTPARLEKLLERMKETHEHIPKNTGEYIKIVSKDILSEEGETLVNSGLEWKEVVKPITANARNYFLQRFQAFDI